MLAILSRRREQLGAMFVIPGRRRGRFGAMLVILSEAKDLREAVDQEGAPGRPLRGDPSPSAQDDMKGSLGMTGRVHAG